MASITKHKDDTFFFIKHSCRELPPSKRHSNIEIDPARRKDNYSILKRGRSNAAKINNYRKAIEKQLYHIKREGLVKSIEICITLPTDCPEHQEKQFFTACVEYISTLVPKEAIFLAEVHKDEGIPADDGSLIAGRPHIHIMFVPAVPDKKHPGYHYKLCADALTRKKNLREFHPGLQQYLIQSGIKASVYTGATGGKNMTVKELKAITKATGLTLQNIRELESKVHIQDAENRKLKNAACKALSIKDQQLADILRQNEILQSQAESLQEAYLDKQRELLASKEKIKELEAISEARTWGNNNRTWGESSGWDTHHDIEGERGRTW